MKLENVVPWGRSASEYIAMFDLKPQDLEGRILDCGGGPSSFTAEMTRQGNKAISCDPLYAFSTEEIKNKITETYPRMLALNEVNKDNFVWNRYGSPKQLAEARLRTMDVFLEDYEEGRQQGRYVIGELPSLPFADNSFDLALCSHLLFTYTKQFSEKFHIESILEMARVARQVRVFPILTAFAGEVSPHLPLLRESLVSQGFMVYVHTVGYEFQKGGNQMLMVTPPRDL